MVGIQVHPDGATTAVGGYLHFRQLSSGEHPPALGIPLEPVADGLAQCSGPRHPLTMLAPIGGVLGVARQGSEHLIVSVGKPYALHGQIFTELYR